MAKYKQYGNCGNGGHGSGKGKSTGKSGKPKSTTTSQKNRYEFHPHGNTLRQTASFTTIKEKILRKLQKDLDNGQDIINSLESSILIDVGSMSTPLVETAPGASPE